MRFTTVLAAAAAALAAGATPAQAASGKILFLRCASCHAIAPGAPVKIGPNLGGVVGRKGGSLSGYRYSPAMTANGPIWNEANLDLWLTAPASLVPGTSMAFGGIASAADRKALIAYLRSPG